MEIKELKGLANYCNTHPCEEYEFCEECDEIWDKIVIVELNDEISNSPCYWSDEDINCVLTLINKEV
ncbi:hypothetical protein ACFO6R_14815 [Eubacterium multiforme]|uniref:Uncharacterized protein n=1 Tax=Eubacterium multiforme TaxID=83339 RepID=A0ABT9UWJ1_9FIRM|nr:hypothetical protein [Eubacterium multiforme]MDQ0150697.1 hypothetical protein [Eubacterium multiforme]